MINVLAMISWASVGYLLAYEDIDRAGRPAFRRNGCRLWVDIRAGDGIDKNDWIDAGSRDGPWEMKFLFTGSLSVLISPTPLCSGWKREGLGAKNGC